jgi:hypothetical protein
VRVFLFCFFINLSFAHPPRVRYIDPKMQKAYEEHCRTQKGYKIPPEGKKPPTSLPAPSIGTQSHNDSQKIKSDPQKPKNPSLSSNKEKAPSNSNEFKTQNPKVSTSSSASPSSIPTEIRSLNFITSGWFWNEELEWIYISKKTYPYFYSAKHKKWELLIVAE